jgi:hypothetical protein
VPIVRARIRDVCCVPAAACAEAGSAPSDALRNGGPRRGFLRFLKFLSFLRFEREEPQELQELQELQEPDQQAQLEAHSERDGQVLAVGLALVGHRLADLL